MITVSRFSFDAAEVERMILWLSEHGVDDVHIGEIGTVAARILRLQFTCDRQTWNEWLATTFDEEEHEHETETSNRKSQA